MPANNTPTDQVIVVRAEERPSEVVGVGEGPSEALSQGRGHPIAFACQHCSIRVSSAAASARQCKKQLASAHVMLIAFGPVCLVACMILVLFHSAAPVESRFELGIWFMPLVLITFCGCPGLGCYGLRRTFIDGPYCCKCLKEARTWSTPYFWIRACRFCKKKAAGGPNTDVPSACEYSFERVQASTNQLLSSDRFARANPDSLAGLLRRLELLKQAGIPPMKVLPMTKLIELGRIPHSSEGFALDAAEALAAYPEAKLSRPLAPIYFFSHRWLRPDWCEALQKDVAYGTEEWEQARRSGLRMGLPDDAGDTKARSLIQTLRWFVEEHSRTQAQSWEEKCMYMMGERHLYKRKPLEEVFLWIDWPCIDQNNPLPEIAALPAYVSCCSGIMAAYNETYMTRAWCRVEILNAFAFCSCNTMHTHDKMYIRNGKGPRNYYASDWVVPPIIVVKEGFEYAGGKGFLQEESILVSLPDPRLGVLTNPREHDVIDMLTNSATNSRAFTWFRVWYNFHTSNLQMSLSLVFYYSWFSVGFIIGGWAGPVLGVLGLALMSGAVLRFTWQASRRVEPGVSELKLFYPNPGTVTDETVQEQSVGSDAANTSTRNSKGQLLQVEDLDFGSYLSHRFVLLKGILALLLAALVAFSLNS